jgi:hypothetical protein
LVAKEIKVKMKINFPREFKLIALPGAAGCKVVVVGASDELVVCPFVDEVDGLNEVVVVLSVGVEGLRRFSSHSRMSFADELDFQEIFCLMMTFVLSTTASDTFSFVIIARSFKIYLLDSFIYH